MQKQQRWNAVVELQYRCDLKTRDFEAAGTVLIDKTQSNHRSQPNVRPNHRMLEERTTPFLRRHLILQSGRFLVSHQLGNYSEPQPPTRHFLGHFSRAYRFATLENVLP